MLFQFKFEPLKGSRYKNTVSPLDTFSERSEDPATGELVASSTFEVMG